MTIYGYKTPQLRGLIDFTQGHPSEISFGLWDIQYCQDIVELKDAKHLLTIPTRVTQVVEESLPLALYIHQRYTSIRVLQVS